ncbi:unnamed protein product [Rotaria socialis]
MGAPLAPIIADVFMTNLETTLMDDLINAGVSEWHQYVDDTFVLVNSITCIDNILSILNNFRPSITFTYKVEDGDRLEFLDVFITRSTECQSLGTTIYHKPTYPGLLTNYHSYFRMQYKKGGIITMVNRALIICSTYTSLATEFNEIRRIGLMNGYTSSFIDTLIGIKLSEYRKKNNDVMQSSQTDLMLKNQCMLKYHL